MKVQTYEEVFGKKLTVSELVEGFNEDTKTGKVTAFGGKLNVRPEYQREFIYGPEKQQAVIETVMKGYPLNVMYWAKTDDGTFELMDGQQRTISLCKFYDVQQIIPMLVNGKVRNYTFEEFDDEMTEKFLSYPIEVYICDGSEREKMEWFRIINIAGVKLTDQEMRNAIYSGPWITDAKRYFSNPKGEGFLSEGHTSNGHIYGDYLNVVGGASSEKENAVIRQKLLETVIEWATDAYNLALPEGADRIDIEDYMRIHRKDKNALELWRYYEDVLEWAKETFPTYHKIMAKVQWGLLYNRCHADTPADADEKAEKIFAEEDEIKNIRNVYEAVLKDDMKLIQPRMFDARDKKWAYEKQHHKCAYCHGEFELDQMDADHIVPWSKGGKTERPNLQMLCRECNIKKSNYDTRYRPWDEDSYEEFDLDKWDEEAGD